MGFIKYPTMLYMGGDVRAKYATARNEDEEIALLAEGYRAPFDYPAADEAPAEKAEKVAAEMAEQAEMTEAEKKAALQAARDEAKALGLTFHHKTGLDTILAAIEKKRLEG